MNRARAEQRTITLAERTVAFSVVTSPTGKRVRVRVGPDGVVVILPRSAPPERAAEVLVERSAWVLRQLDRVESLDAIVIHELAHLVEPTHQTRFWLLVHSHCPEYANRVRWLADHQQEFTLTASALP